MPNYKWDKEGFQPRTPADVMLELETWMPQYTDKHKFVLLYHKEFVDFIQTQVDAAYEEGSIIGMKADDVLIQEGYQAGLKRALVLVQSLQSEADITMSHGGRGLEDVWKKKGTDKTLEEVKESIEKELKEKL